MNTDFVEILRIIENEIEKSKRVSSAIMLDYGLFILFNWVKFVGQIEDREIN